MSYLPHIYPLSATFFITFRLANSLPQHIIDQIKEEYICSANKIKEKYIDKKRQEILIYNLKKEMFGNFEHQLDKNPYGMCYMKNASVAEIIYNKIMEYHSRYYNVHAISIMPNHVHMLLDTSNQISNDELIEHVPDNFVDVGNWMQLIKGGSAFQINKYLGRSGKLWANESFDHYVRFNKEGEYERIKDYILQNPIKAGLGIKYRKKPFLYSI